MSPSILILRSWIRRHGVAWRFRSNAPVMSMAAITSADTIHPPKNHTNKTHFSEMLESKNILKIIPHAPHDAISTARIIRNCFFVSSIFSFPVCCFSEAILYRQHFKRNTFAANISIYFKINFSQSNNASHAAAQPRAMQVNAPKSRAPRK